MAQAPSRSPMEDPMSLLARFRLRREEHLQRLLTMLVLQSAFPRGNSLNAPSRRGSAFLHKLDARCFGRAGAADTAHFADEFALPKRRTSDHDNAVDWALLSDDRLWMIELKTERNSHNPPQLPEYLDRANHFHPGLLVDLTYLTPPMTVTAPALRRNMRFAHVTWDDVLPLIQGAWLSGSDAERSAVAAVEQIIEGIGTPWWEWRLNRLTSAGVDSTAIEAPLPPPQGRIDPVTEAVRSQAIELAIATSIDRKPRALNYEAPDISELRLLSVAVRNALLDPDLDPALRHVNTWIWDSSSTDGRPYTTAGSRTGLELRISWYGSPSH